MTSATRTEWLCRKRKSRWGDKPTGRMKPCVICGTEFYCTPYRDVGGAGGERIYCSFKCRCVGVRAKLDDVEARFWEKVVKRGEDECWGWTAQKRWDGYGRFVNRYKPMWAHRFSYELHHGQIPKGMSVMHTCDNPECTNPKHLTLGTHKENMADAKRKLRHAWGERSNKAKLTADLVRALRSEYRQIGPRKTNIDELAARYGIALTTAYAAATGRSWRHLK